MATENFQLFHSQIAEALRSLSDPNETVCRSLVEGKAAGKLELIYGLFPPHDIHKNQVPARYTFTVEEHISFEISVMLSLVAEMEPYYLIFGFIAHDRWQEMHKESGGMEVDGGRHWVAVKYCPVTRDGEIFLSKEVYAVVEAVKGEALDSLHRRQEE